MSDNIEYGTTGKPHPYHMVAPSIWPFLTALSAGLMAVGGVMFMHDKGSILLISGFIALLTCMFLWWKDIIFEAVVEKAHSAVARIGFRFGMMLFILSELMFFVAFFWAFFSSALYPADGVWPPAGVITVSAFDLPLLMTMILLLSGCTVTWAHMAVLNKDNNSFVKAIGLTVILGIIFLGFQAYEYSHLEFGFTDGIFSSTFYMATGFHGFHVLVGTIFLAVAWRRAKLKHFTKKSHFGFEAAAWYWHFVDVVWLFLFIAVYFWGGGDATSH